MTYVDAEDDDSAGATDGDETGADGCGDDGSRSGSADGDWIDCNGGGGNGELNTQKPPQSVQSVPCTHAENSDPGPPSSQSPSSAHGHGATPSATGQAGGGELTPHLTSQSAQSAPSAQKSYSDPGPPSSQKLSCRKAHASVQTHPLGSGGRGGRAGDGGEGGGGRYTPQRIPQSKQSLPAGAQTLYSDPAPPSSQSTWQRAVCQHTRFVWRVRSHMFDNKVDSPPSKA